MALAIDSEMTSAIGMGEASPATPWLGNGVNFNNTGGTFLLGMFGLGVHSADTATFGAPVNYGVTALTKQVEATTTGAAAGGKIGVYYAQNPVTGSNAVSIPQTVSVGGALPEIWGGFVSFTGAHATTPIVQTHVSVGNSALASDTITGVTSGNIVIVVCGAGSSITGLHSGSPGVITWTKNVDGNSSLGNGICSKVTGSSGSIQSQFDISGADSWVVVSVEVGAAGGAVASSAPNLIILSGNRW